MNSFSFLAATRHVVWLTSLTLLACGGSDDNKNPSNRSASTGDMSDMSPSTDLGRDDAGADTGDEPDATSFDPMGDEDGDGLTNQEELEGWMISVDRVGLGMATAMLVTSDPDKADTDGDGLSDRQEYQKTDPNRADTDGDGVSDFDEVNVYLSIATSVDTDGDSVSGNTSNPQLWDGDEITKWGTSPSLADTDGDNRTDFDEIINNATNPLVAEVPLVDVSFVGDIDIRLDVSYENGEVADQSFGSSYASTQSESQSRTSGTAITNSVEHTRAISLEVESGWPPSATVNVSRSTTTGYSNESSSSLTTDAAQSAQREYQRAQSFSRQYSESVSQGSLSMGMMISNPSSIAYTLTNLTVAVYQWDRDTQQFKTVGTMTPDSLTGVNLSPNSQIPAPIQVSADHVNADLVREFLKKPTSLTFAVSNFDMENSEGLNYVFLDEVTQARTGRIMIDYGDGRVDDFRVATNVRRNEDGSLAGVKLSTVLTDYLDIPYETQDWVPTDTAGPLADKAGTKVLTRLRDVENTAMGEPTGFWVVFSDIADLQGSYKDFDDTVLQRGETLFIAYLRDADGDGVYDREEDFYQTSDQDEDSDDDMISDFEEAKVGWMAGAGLDASLGYPRQVFSDPATTDADEDGLDDFAERMAGTDPYNPDTDQDTIPDGVDSSPLDGSNEPPVIALTGDLSQDPVVRLTGSVTDLADAISGVSIDWGDGQVVQLTQGFDAVDVSHAYFVPGPYTITITATDERMASDSVQIPITTTTPYAMAYFPIENGQVYDAIGQRSAVVWLASGRSSAYGFDRFNLDNQSLEFYKSPDNDSFTYAYLSNFGTIPLDNFSIAFWGDGGGNQSSVIMTQPQRFKIKPDGSRSICLELGEVGGGILPVCTTGASAGFGWNFYAITKQGDDIKIYVNGVLDVQTIRANIPSQSCQALFFNGDNQTSGCESQPNASHDNEQAFINGYRLDDLRIFERTLTASDVSTLYGERGYMP